MSQTNYETPNTKDGELMNRQWKIMVVGVLVNGLNLDAVGHMLEFASFY